MKKIFLSLIASGFIAFSATAVMAEQHRHGKGGEDAGMTFEQRKAHMLSRIEQRKQCVVAAKTSEELKLCHPKKGDGKRGKKQSDQQ